MYFARMEDFKIKPVIKPGLLIGCDKKSEIMRHFQGRLCDEKGLFVRFFQGELTLFCQVSKEKNHFNVI